MIGGREEILGSCICAPLFQINNKDKDQSYCGSDDIVVSLYFFNAVMSVHKIISPTSYLGYPGVHLHFFDDLEKSFAKILQLK